jgi:hypothetical protein
MKKLLASLIICAGVLVACDDEPRIGVAPGYDGTLMECVDGQQYCNNGAVETCIGGNWTVTTMCFLNGQTCDVGWQNCGGDPDTYGVACCVDEE